MDRQARAVDDHQQRVDEEKTLPEDDAEMGAQDGDPKDKTKERQPERFPDNHRPDLGLKARVQADGKEGQVRRPTPEMNPATCTGLEIEGDGR